MKKILILGSNGMLGKAFCRQLKDEYKVVTVAREEADYCLNLINDEELEECFEEIKPDIVINAAGCVNLNLCEDDKELAYMINARMPGIAADLSRKYGAYFVHISTDHYYKDDSNRKHSELDRIVLVNEYARSKYIGECLALLYDRTLVLRTNIVGFRNTERETFLEWVIKSIKEKRKFTLFTDFYTSSMYTEDFVRVCLDLMRINETGLYNVASSSVSSKKEFIMLLSQKLNEEISYEDGSVKNINGVMRGESLGLSTEKVEKILGYSMPTAEETITHIVDEINRSKKI